MQVPFQSDALLPWGSGSVPDGGDRIFAEPVGAGSDELRWLQLWTLVKRHPLSGTDNEIKLRARNTVRPLGGSSGRTSYWIGPKWEGSQAAPLSPFVRWIELQVFDVRGDNIPLFSDITITAFALNLWTNQVPYRNPFVQHRGSIARFSSWCGRVEPTFGSCLEQVLISRVGHSFDVVAARRDTQTEFASQRRDLTQQVLAVMANPNSLVAQAAA